MPLDRWAVPAQRQRRRSIIRVANTLFIAMDGSLGWGRGRRRVGWFNKISKYYEIKVLEIFSKASKSLSQYEDDQAFKKKEVHPKEYKLQFQNLKRAQTTEWTPHHFWKNIPRTSKFLLIGLGYGKNFKFFIQMFKMVKIDLKIQIQSNS